MTEPVTCQSCLREYIPLDRDARPRCGVCIARRNRVWISVGITAGIVGAIAVAFAVMPCGADAKPEPQPAVAPPVIGPPTEDAALALERRVIASCDPERAMGLVQLYNEERKYTDAVRAGTAFQTKCARSARLDWDVLYAHEQLENWKAAHAITDKLLNEDPSDSDFWWWRGKDRRHLGEHAGAVVDLRQSLSMSTERSNGVQIDHLDAAAKALGQPCEPAFGLRWLAAIGVDLHSRAERQMRETYFQHECGKLDGTGELAWPTDELKRPKLAGKLGGKPVKLMIDRRLGTTLVRRGAVELESTATAQVLTPTGLATGALALAEIAAGKAAAGNVPVAIVDTLPEGVDAVIGLSFLWRFDVKLSDDGESWLASPARDE